MTQYALSIKQPWATLVVHGHKTIEVRKWPTARRGPVLIHAGRIPDERPEAWKHLPADLLEQARLLGGFIGRAELIDCRKYTTAEEFCADQALHLNEPDWWQAPALYGFRFAQASATSFVRYPGWMRFFPVPEPLERPRTDSNPTP